jgi:hypothetical protein
MAEATDIVEGTRIVEDMGMEESTRTAEATWVVQAMHTAERTPMAFGTGMASRIAISTAEQS